jgi:hypothetical protein
LLPCDLISHFLLLAGFCDYRSLPPANLAASFGYNKKAVKTYGTHAPLEKVW